MTIKGLFINGTYTFKGNTYTLKAPYGGKELAKIALGSPEDVSLAIGKAHEAFVQMREMPAHKRAGILFRVAWLLQERRQEAAEIIAREAGKPISLALGEINRAITTYQFSGEEAKRITGETIPMDAAPGGEGRIGMTWQEPLGAVVAITPFNFPFNLVAHKLGPAIAAGNTVVLKPAEQTPLSALYTAGLFKEAGLPDGALHVITGIGKDLSDALLLDDRVRKVTFTGSAVVGKIIKSKIGLKRCTLELGSNSALIVEPGVPLDKVVPRAVFGAFAYMGQVCISLQRIYVHKAVYQEFTDRFKAQVSGLVTGDPLDENTDISAMISEQEAIRIDQWVQEDLAKGARALCGAERQGSIYLPTVLINLNRDMNMLRREAFAPVVAISPYNDLAEAVEMVNDSDYGLNTGVYTQNITDAFEASRKIRSGTVIINDIPTFRVDHMPYGGVKDSGYGREGVKYAIREMTETKFVTVNLNFKD